MPNGLRARVQCVTMSRGPQRFRQREVIRVLRAVEKSGVPVQIKIVPKEGAIFLIPDTPGQVRDQDGNEWDSEYGTDSTEVR